MLLIVSLDGFTEFWDFISSENDVSKQVNENSDSLDENSMSNGIQEVSPDKGHTLPILKKILDLSTRIQVNL